MDGNEHNSGIDNVDEVELNVFSGLCILQNCTTSSGNLQIPKVSEAFL
jgi:hypothetical protein